MDLQIDDNLLNILVCKDQTKIHRKLRAQTKEGKSNRSTVKYKNLAEGHKVQMDNLKTGDVYESGIAVVAAKKTLKAAPKRNDRLKKA